MDPMRKFLYGLSKDIRVNDLQDMMFLLKLPEAVSEKISSALQLFTHLTKTYRNDDVLVKCLEDTFTEMEREDLKEQVLKYVREHHHDSLVKSTSFPTQEPRTTEAITRCQSFQGPPQQSEICEALAERVQFSSAPNSPPEERHITPVPLQLSDERRSGELCSQLDTATENPLAARSQSEARSQPAGKNWSEERIQSIDRSQSEDRIHSADRSQSEDRIHSTDRSQSEDRIQSVDRRQSEHWQSNSSQNKQNNAGCASGQMEQRIPTHSLGMKTLAESCKVLSDTADSPVPGKDQTRELHSSSLGSYPDRFSQNSENETKLKELYIGNSESSPSISSALGNVRNRDENLIATNATLFTAESCSELADLDCDGSQLTAKVSTSLVSPISRKLTCSEIEREMILDAPGAKGNTAESTIRFVQSPRTQNSSCWTILSQTVPNSIGEPDHCFDPDQGNLGTASSATADEPHSDETHHIPQGFYANFLRKHQSKDGLKKTQETIVMRNYQKELAKPGMEGKNCIICAPTGSGKTLTAGYICQLQRMKAAVERRPFKALFIVCIRNLVLQQRDALSQIIVSEDGSKPVGGLGETTLLSEYMKTYDVTVLTAQILVNCLKTGEVRMSDIDLLIMDECHHTTLNHPYSTIMLEYHLLRKENPSRKLPQVIGLTASLGVGSAGDDPLGAVYHYIRLCANLDCTSITHVKDKEHLEELLVYNPKPQKDQIISVEPRSTENIFYQVRPQIFAQH